MPDGKIERATKMLSRENYARAHGFVKAIMRDCRLTKEQKSELRAMAFSGNLEMARDLYEAMLKAEGVFYGFRDGD